MHKYLKVIVFIAVAVVFSVSLKASAFSAAEQGVKFSAYCKTQADVIKAVESGASFVSIGGTLTLADAVKAVDGKAAIIIDADSIDQADAKYSEFTSLGAKGDVYYRINTGASKATSWAQGKNAKIIGYYKGNIFPIAVGAISSYGKASKGAIIQMQTNNQDGVILHNSVSSNFAKRGAYGMFSFADSTRSAKRTDTERSWDDLIARGYTIIETAYPADFANYLEGNTSERLKLAESVNSALATKTEGCSPNRVSDYKSALEKAQALLSDGSSATYAMADARAILDEAVANITIQDGSQIKGDLKFTPARIGWALFGIALVLSWQIFFRKRWAKS